MGGMKTCLDWAIDGFNVTGTPLVYYFNNNLAVTYSGTPNLVKPIFNTGGVNDQLNDFTFYGGTKPAGDASTYYNLGGVT